MSVMFARFCAMFTTLFTAGEKLAKTVENLATVAEEVSGSYMDQSRIDREVANSKRLKSLKA